jgi:hypothetical protein
MNSLGRNEVPTIRFFVTIIEEEIKNPLKLSRLTPKYYLNHIFQLAPRFMFLANSDGEPNSAKVVATYRIIPTLLLSLHIL